jgi:Protein of unknown function (DUF2934)
MREEKFGSRVRWNQNLCGLGAGRRWEVSINDRDRHIREIAYYLWEQEGCPEDQAERHWSAAVAVVEAQDADGENMEEDPRGAAFKGAAHLRVSRSVIGPAASSTRKSWRRAEIGGLPLGVAIGGRSRIRRRRERAVARALANADLGSLEPLGEITEAAFDLVDGVNVKGTVFAVQKGLPLTPDGGSIIHPHGIDDGLDGNAGLQHLQREQGRDPQSRPQLGARPEGHWNSRERALPRPDLDARNRAPQGARRVDWAKGRDGRSAGPPNNPRTYGQT